MADREVGNASVDLVATPVIEQRIYVIRERQVMLDEDLADLYCVETKRLIEQVKRNLERFPEDFMFQLRKDEAAALRSQIATSNTGRGGRRYAPYVFTEQGVAMLSSVLRSKTAIAVNIEIMRAFVELRRVANSYAAIQKRLEQIERGWASTMSSSSESSAPSVSPSLRRRSQRGRSDSGSERTARSRSLGQLPDAVQYRPVKAM
jgi:hypothetical protein